MSSRGSPRLSESARKSKGTLVSVECEGGGEGSCTCQGRP